MTVDEFMEHVNEAVSESAIESTIATLVHPPGRKPDPEIVRLSQWYLGLSDVDKAEVKAVVRRGVGFALFGFFCVLDGVRFLEGEGDKGEFELYFVKGDQRVRINDPQYEELHNLYNWYSRDRFKVDDSNPKL